MSDRKITYIVLAYCLVLILIVARVVNNASAPLEKLSRDLWDECHPHCGKTYAEVPNICLSQQWICHKERP